jgi:DNA-binding NarL/FixJ family response regulator
MRSSLESNRTESANKISKILIVDDHELIRDGMRQLLGRQSGVNICGECASVNEAKQWIQKTNPDVVVTDLRLRDSSGLDLIKWIVDRKPQIKIIVCSMHSEQAYGERVLRLGAMGFISKECSASSFLTAVRKVLDGGFYFSEELAHQVLRRSIPNAKICDHSPISNLSDRELEILTLLGEGCSTEKIAARLFLSRNTIGTYRERLKTKLQLKNCSELVFFAMRWVRDGESPMDSEDPSDGPFSLEKSKSC